MASALRALRQAAAVDRGYHASYVVRAHLHLERGEIADAAAALASVREMEEAGVGAPVDGRQVLTALGALAHGRADEAEQQLAVGLANPTATSPFAMLMVTAVHAVTGLRHELAGHYAEALEAFETAVSLATENPRRVGMGGWWARAMAGRGRAFLRLTRRAEADRTHQELVAEFDARRQFTWGYGMGATDAEVLVDRAALEASAGVRRPGRHEPLGRRRPWMVELAVVRRAARVHDVAPCARRAGTASAVAPAPLRPSTRSPAPAGGRAKLALQEAGIPIRSSSA